jgi:hypothetical protein
MCANQPESDGDDRSTEESTRRRFLKGTGAFAAGGTLLDPNGNFIGGAEGATVEQQAQQAQEDGGTREFTVHAIEMDIVYNTSTTTRPRPRKECTASSPA